MSCSKSNETVNHINCDGLITDTLGINDNGRIFMQNAFTPNSDGMNDVNRVIVKNISAIVFTIYDGNNAVVFTTTQLTSPDPNGFASTAAWAPTTNASTYEIYYYKIQATTSSNNHIGTCGELYKLACFPSGIPMTSLYFESQLLTNGTYSPNSGETIPNCP
jgi:hypothetical protein